MKFKVTFRVDTEESFILDEYEIEAPGLLEAALTAYYSIEKPLNGTLWRIERVD